MCGSATNVERHALLSLFVQIFREGGDEVYSSCIVLKRDTLSVLLNLLLEPLLSNSILVTLPSPVHHNGIGW